jgi:hypothetical protein
MDRTPSRGAALARAGTSALALTGALLLVLAGCKASSAAAPSSASPSSASASSASASSASARAATVSASPGLSIPGTHKATAVHQISSPVGTLVVVSHVGDVTVMGGNGPATSVTEQSSYSKTPPVTTRTLSGRTLTVTYACPDQLVCAVSYVVQVPRDVTVQVTAGAGSIRLSGLAGSVTAKADVGLISATGLTGASVTLTTSAGSVSATFATPPVTVRLLARVGAITVRVPVSVSYHVSANAHVGHATVSVPQSSSSARTIIATTDVGAILIGPVQSMGR